MFLSSFSLALILSFTSDTQVAQRNEDLEIGQTWVWTLFLWVRAKPWTPARNSPNHTTPSLQTTSMLVERLNMITFREMPSDCKSVDYTGEEPKEFSVLFCFSKWLIPTSTPEQLSEPLTCGPGLNSFLIIWIILKLSLILMCSPGWKSTFCRHSVNVSFCLSFLLQFLFPKSHRNFLLVLLSVHRSFFRSCFPQFQLPPSLGLLQSSYSMPLTPFIDRFLFLPSEFTTVALFCFSHAVLNVD